MARTPRRVTIERIQGDAARQVSFSKRRQGLFKKVCELSTLCGAETAVLVHSPAGRIYSLGDPDVHTVVDRFLEYAAQQEAAGAGTAQQQAGDVRAPHQQNRRGGPQPEFRRRVIEESLYRQLAEQDEWNERAKVVRAMLMDDLKEKEARLPHRWAVKADELELREAEEMTDALEELAVRVRALISMREEEDGVPQDRRWTSEDLPLPPANPWRRAAYFASFNRSARSYPLQRYTTVDTRVKNTFTAPAFPQNLQYPLALPPVSSLQVAENFNALSVFMGTGAGGSMGMPMAPPHIVDIPSISSMATGKTNMLPNMVNMVPDMTNMVPGMANMPPGGQNMASGMENMAPGMENVVPGTMNMVPGVSFSRMMSMAPGMSPGGMMNMAPDLSTSGMMSMAPGGIISMAPGMSPGGMVNMAPGMSPGGMVNMAPGMMSAISSYNFASSSSAPLPHDQKLMPAPEDDEGSSSGLEPQHMFYR